MKRKALSSSFFTVNILICVLSLIISNSTYAAREVDSRQPNQASYQEESQRGPDINPSAHQNFNPQKEVSGNKMMPGRIHKFDPQPEPPGKAKGHGKIHKFNPQPEPPGKSIKKAHLKKKKVLE